LINCNKPIIRYQSILIVSFLFFSLIANSQYWSEYWQQFNYRETNYSDVKPEEVRDFQILTTSIKLGYRKYLTRPDVNSNKWIVGIDPFLKFENVHDFANTKYRHDNIFNNNYKYGGGLKIRLYKYKLLGDLINYIQLDLYSEYLVMSTYVNNVEYWLDIIEPENWRTGLNSWMTGEFYKSGKTKLAYESYLDFSYNSTNFSDPGNSPYLIFIFSPKLYFRYRTFDIYVNEEIVYDFLIKGVWNRNPFSNNLKSIFGIRFIFTSEKLFNLDDENVFSNLSIMLYSEYSLVNYLDDESKWPWPDAEIADHDVRVGFTIWWPLGESKKVPKGFVPNF